MAIGHQSSLEGIFDSPHPSVVFHDAASRRHAEELFSSLLDQLEVDGLGDGHGDGGGHGFRPVVMLRVMHQVSLSQLSKDLFLNYFFASIRVDMAVGMASTIDIKDVRSRAVEFAQFLNGSFFGPLKAAGKRTPQPTPASFSVPFLSSEQSLPGSESRVATLRRDCLIRDRHRCVITRQFDENEAFRRTKKHGYDAADDDGVRFADMPETDEFELLEVAHILPHSLMSMANDDDRSIARRNALAILEMLDTGVPHLFEGASMDRPTNAITLTSGYHSVFGSFRTFFEAMDGPLHTYRIQSVLQSRGRRPLQPITRTLFLSDTVDPPLPRLLAVHAAICRILHLSGAGAYWDHIFREAEDEMANADGSTSLGPLVTLRLGGWWDGKVV
ncbi:hypothetical protein SPBR_05977 [Sporothrix brasiliensis 5110]|uniref:HNH nuclease domain-containing protein n=1 Tax=Sporothrix brasiliensis 5110 TaxID=1398154 RepID=A0A0C2J4Q5_9PEZI|nr:uncharacterized protein SPBR_05977 [Sporothrix brasiliensis 5110]KIH94010.1 hypothetical protein SPBR_05977 [Sporothrix brasiliensis 5110]